MQIERSEIVRLTEEHGGAWGINHTRRVLHLVERIGEGLPYDAETIWLAAYLHDWGAYMPWAQQAADHVARSVEVANEFLTARGCIPDLKDAVLQCIALHHTAGADRSIEAILLRDADALDFLGIIGILRDFSKNPRDLRKAYDQICKRRESLPEMLHLDKARVLGAERIREMDSFLALFETESFGCF